MTSPLLAHLARKIAGVTGGPFTPTRSDAGGGGCINRTLVLDGGGARYFVKLNDAARRDMFAAEAEGLRTLAATGTARVPAPLCHGVAEGQAFLVLEYLPLQAADARAQETLGRQLAQLHRATAPTFGWHRDNAIGSTPQINTPTDNWIGFWREHRLGFQLQLAADNGGALSRKGEQLLDALPVFFKNYHPVPSLLHGDLWGGNAAATGNGEPVIFDPAVYYGDRETDIAMTELFGGFPARFYAAYREAWPLDTGYRVRKSLYNLYHVLNHFNLFGGGYLSQAERLIDDLLAATR